MATEVRKLVIGAEVRTAGNFQIVGKALTYNQLSPTGNLGPNQAERVATGCFADSLESGADVKCLVNHNADRILGRRANKTLTLSDGPDALRFTVQLNPKSQAHQDVYASVQRGDLNQCSFAFQVEKDLWGEGKDVAGAPIQIRTLLKAKLLDVSVVTFPFYNTEGATVAEARAKKSPTTKYATASQKEERAAALIELSQSFRKLARVMAKTICSDGPDISLEDNMEQTQTFLEAAYGFSGTVAGMFDVNNACDPDSPDYSPDDPDCDDFRSIAKAHGTAHMLLEKCCNDMAEVRARISQRRKKSGRK